MEITVDSRRCGAGKTYDIINKIKNNTSKGIPTLVALPSIKLAKEYTKKLNALVINTETVGNRSSCSYELTQAMMKKDMVIIITHHNFINANLGPFKQSIRDYALIIDEAIEPWRNVEIKQKAKEKLLKDWHPIMSLDESLIEPGYYECTFKSLDTNTFFQESETARQLTNTNFDSFLTEKQVLNIEQGKAFSLDFIQEIKKEVLTGWKSIHVAAALFDKTFLSLWFTKHQLKYSIQDGYEFIKHTSELNIHYPEDLSVTDGGISWSRNMRTKNSAFMNEVNMRVNKMIKGRKAMMLLNVSESSNIKYPTAVALPHNNYGSNDFNHFTDVILESTMNHKPVVNTWFEEHASHYLGLNEIEANQWAYDARTGYAYYQTLLRGSARLNKPITAYVIDVRAVNCLMDCFVIDIDSLIQWQPNIMPENKRVGRPEGTTKGRKLSSTDYARISKAKKTDPEKYKDLKPLEIYDLLSSQGL